MASWEIFMEKIADLLGHFLTDDETERVLRTLPKESVLHQRLRNTSSEAVTRLAREAPDKRPHCQHKGSCRVNCTRGFIRTFVGAYVVKYIVAILPGLLQGKIARRPKLLLKHAGIDTLRFALFLSTFVAGFKGLQCALRRYRRVNDEWNAFIAGAVSALALAIDEKSRRVAIALYLSTRALEFVYIYLMRRKYLPNIPHGDTIVMAMSAAQILNAFMLDADTLTKSYFDFLLVHGGLAKHGPIGKSFLRDIGRTVQGEVVDLASYKHIVGSYPGMPFEQLQHADLCTKLHAMEHPMTTNCYAGAANFFIESIPRSLRLYVPLNIVMSVLFRHQQLLKRPDIVLWRTALSSVRSSAFLSAYCTTAWLVPCILRDLLGKDYWFSYYINGLCAGACVLIEAEPRRIELAMYCAPRALESAWNCLVKYDYARNVPNGEVLYFALAMGALMAIYQHEPDDLNGTYRGVLTRVFGCN